MSFLGGTREVDIEGARALLNETERDLSDIARAERFYVEIDRALKKLTQDTERLKNARPKEGISDALRIRGVPNRDVMVSNLGAIKKISVPKEKDYRSVLSFYREASSAMEIPFGKLSYNIRFVKAVFPEEVKTVVSDVKRLRSLFEHMAAPLLKKEDVIRAIDKSREILDVMGVIDAPEGTKVELRTSDVERRLEEEKKRLLDIKGSEQWKLYDDLNRKLSAKKEELKETESEAESILSPIRKVLSLLKKEDETGKRTLLPEERKAVNELLSSPMEAILKGECKEQLLLVKKALEGDAVINSDKREKGLRDIERILKEDFSSRAVKIKNARKEVDALGRELAQKSINDELGRAERRAEDLERELRRAREEEDRSERHKVSRNRELSENLSELSSLLSRITGKKIRVAR